MSVLPNYFIETAKTGLFKYLNRFTKPNICEAKLISKQIFVGVFTGHFRNLLNAFGGEINLELLYYY